VSAEALLPERALAGDAEAREELLNHVYRPLAQAGDVVLETVTAFLEAGGSLEATARALFVHPNTVRYRLRRVAELCGESPTTPRGGYAIHIALTLGRLEASA
jgi:DNA-binding PucR family transcriptional regulator